MSNSCEIISPSRSSKTIRVVGSEPYNEGSNDKIVSIKENTSKKKDFAAQFLVMPALSNDKTIVPLMDRNIDLRLDTKVPPAKQEDVLKRRFFSDLNQNNTLNSRLEKSNTKLESRKGVTRKELNNNNISYGISNTVANLEDISSNLSANAFVSRPAIFKSPPDLDVLDEMYKNDDVSIEYYSSPNKISKNGLIEPLYIRETSTFEFSEKSVKASLMVNDVRIRSFVIKETLNYHDKPIEFFEDNIDTFSNQTSSVINNKFIETYNAITGKYTVTTSANKVHSNKLLDVSWISNDSARSVPYEQKYNTLESEVNYSDYVTLNNSEIMEYYIENNVTISNQYPKIFEDKFSTGYTYDRSKVQGLNSIAFNDYLE